MSKLQRSLRSLAFGAALGLFVGGCVGTTPPPEGVAGAVMTLYYTGGGPAPVAGSVVVFENGCMTVNNLSWDEGLACLAPSQWAQLRAALESDGVREQIAYVESLEHDETYHDHESLTIALGSLRATAVYRALPDEVLDGDLGRLLVLLDRQAETLFGEAYDFKLLPRKARR